MITLNEGHNMRAVLQNLAGWASEVLLVDSYSQDDTIDIALQYGVHVVQRGFRGFGDQWNFALTRLPTSSPWTMKLDPDERLSDELKADLLAIMKSGNCDAVSMVRRLWFMGQPLPVRNQLIRLWRTGNCKFTDVLVNEHPLVGGRVSQVQSEMQHHDSPNLEHWLEKQNHYSTAEAAMIASGVTSLANADRLGDQLARRLWMKRNFRRFPGRYQALFLYHFIIQGAWRAGWPGFVWSNLRLMVMRIIEYKARHLQESNRLPVKHYYRPGKPDHRVPQFD